MNHNIKLVENGIKTRCIKIWNGVRNWITSRIVFSWPIELAYLWHFSKCLQKIAVIKNSLRWNSGKLQTWNLFSQHEPFLFFSSFLFGMLLFCRRHTKLDLTATKPLWLLTVYVTENNGKYESQVHACASERKNRIVSSWSLRNFMRFSM